MVLEEMCLEAGYPSIAAVNGMDCIEKLSQNLDAIGVVLMDLHMPKMSGLDTLAAIRANSSDDYRTIPVIVATADVSWHDARVCSEYGFDGVLPKPVKFDQLSEMLGRFGERD